MQRVGIPISRRTGGDVFESFQRINDITRKNDGIRSFSIKTNSCYDSDAPVQKGTQTHLRITNNYHDVNQLSETYIRCKWKMNVKIGVKAWVSGLTGAGTGNALGLPAGTTTPIKLFIGWKNANEAMRQLEVENNNVDCDYLQTEMSREGCAYSAYMPEEKKKNRRFAHSRWEDVEMGVPGQAGIYIDIIADNDAGYLLNSGVGHSGTAGDKADFEFETTIPINDLLAFQAFDEWPGNLGDIVLKWYFTDESMVYGFSDPVAIEEANRFWLTATTDRNINQCFNPNCGTCRPSYTRGFTQIGQASMAPIRTKLPDTGAHAINNANLGDMQIGRQTVSVENLELIACYCDIPGYNVTQECKRNLSSLFTPEHPMIIPSQHLDIKNMPKPNEVGIYDADFTYALHNVTDFIVVWPRTTKDLTCFYNPQFQDLQLRVDGKLYPTNKLENTWDYRFYQMMMNASDLDNYYEADKSYSRSLTAPIPSGWTNTSCPYDISTFLCTFQVERNTAGYCFDGLETGNLNVNIGLLYTNTNSWYDDTKVAPQIWFCRDTYWTVDNVNGLKYHKVGTPPVYASDEA